MPDWPGLSPHELGVFSRLTCVSVLDRPLRDGTLEANQVVHGCQLILLPSVESGLMVSDALVPSLPPSA